MCEGLYNGVEARIVSEEGQSRWFGVERGYVLCGECCSTYSIKTELKGTRMEVKIDKWCGQHYMQMILCFFRHRSGMM